MHQGPLVGLAVAVFLLEVVPLELQRRIVNDAVKNRRFDTVIPLCATYAGAVLVQDSTKLGLNIYRAWVGERAERGLRRCISGMAEAGSSQAQARGTAVSMVVAEVEPIGNFIGGSVSEPLLQTGILATVITYIFHIDLWMGAAVFAFFAPQMVLVPLMQHATHRRPGVATLSDRCRGDGHDIARRGRRPGQRPARIDRVFAIDMRIFALKFTMNFLMNLCTHAQIIIALLLGSWWVLHDQLEVGGGGAFISGIYRITDPWGDLVNYYRDLSVNEVKFKLIAGAMSQARSDASADLSAA